MAENFEIKVDADLNIKGVSPSKIEAGELSFKSVQLPFEEIKNKLRKAFEDAARSMSTGVPPAGAGAGSGGRGPVPPAASGPGGGQGASELFLKLMALQQQAQGETKKLAQEFLALGKAGAAGSAELDKALEGLIHQLEEAQDITQLLSPAGKQLLQTQKQIANEEAKVRATAAKDAEKATIIARKDSLNTQRELAASSFKEEAKLREKASKDAAKADLAARQAIAATERDLIARNVKEQSQIRSKALQDAAKADAAARKIELQTQKELGAQELRRLANIQKIRNELKTLESLQRTGVGGKGADLSKSLGAVSTRGLSGATVAIDSIEQSAGRAGKRVASLAQTIEEVGRKAGAFRAVAIAINTLVNITRTSVGFMITFTDSLLELNKILRLSDTQLLRMGQSITSLSAKTGVVTENVVEIAQEFARAGLSGRGYGSVLELTETALRGVQGTTLDAAQSTQIMIQLIGQIESGARGLNKELITTGKLFDILGRAEDITAAKASDVQDAFKRSANTLLSTGVSAEEVISVISVLQERTQRGGEVIGTALKTIAARITATSSEASRAIQEIGVDVVDKATGNVRNFFDVIFDLGKVFKGLTEEQQKQIAVQVAGIRQVEIFSALMGSLSRVQQVTTDVTLSYNDAARKQAIEQQKLGTMITQIRNEFLNFVQTVAASDLGTVLKGPIVIARDFLNVLNAINEMLGGRIAQTLAAFGLVRVFQAALIFAKGLIPALAAIAKEGNILTKEFFSMRNNAQAVGTQGVAVINSELQKTLGLQGKVGVGFALMKKQAELAALGPAPRRLIQGEPRQATAAQTAELSMILPTGGKSQMVTLNKELGTFGKIADKVGGIARGLASNTLFLSLGFSAAAGQLKTVAENARIAGNTIGSVAANVASSIFEFSALGVIFGPKGAFVGAIIGGLSAILQGARDTRDELEKVGEDLIATGQITKKSGKLDSPSEELISATQNTIESIRSLEKGVDALGKQGVDTAFLISKSADNIGDFSRTLIEDVLKQDFTSEIKKSEAVGAAALNAMLKGALSTAKVSGAPELDKVLTQLTGDTRILADKLGPNVRAIFNNLFETLIEQVDGLENLNVEARTMLKRQLQENVRLLRETSSATVGTLKAALAPVGKVFEAQEGAAAAQARALAKQNLERSREEITRGEGRIGIVFADILDNVSRSFMSLSDAAVLLSSNHKELADVGLGLARRQLEYSKELQSRDLVKARNEIQEIIREFPSASEAQAGAKAFTETLETNLNQILSGASKGAFDPKDLDQLRRKLADTLKAPAQIDDEGLKRLEKISKLISDTVIKGQEEVQKATEKVRQAELQSIRFLLSESQKRIDVIKDETSLMELVSEIETDRATGIIKLTKQLSTLKQVTDLTTSSLDKEIELLKLRAQTVDKGSEAEVVITDQLTKLVNQRKQNILKAEKEINKLQESLLQERVNLVKKEVDDIQSIFSGRNKLVDLLDLSDTKDLDKFKDAINRNASSFQLTTKVLKEELSAIGKSSLDAGSKETALRDLRVRAAKATLDAAIAEAEIMKERRDAIKSLSQEAISNEEQILSAEKSVIDATRNVSEAFKGYLGAIQGLIAANVEFSLQAGQATIESKNITGSFRGLKDQLAASERVFRDVSLMAEEVGASEKILLDIRRESIALQLKLFEQLLNEQSSLAESYFTSTTESQAELFRSVQALQAITGLLGGSFDNFKKLGEDSINKIGAQLLSLPQNIRQGLLQATDVLDKLGVGVEGFTGDQLRTAIQTAALGTSEALDVDPLFAVQDRIAQLIEKQAALQTDGLVQARLGVKTAKEQLQEAKAQKDLAQIQLDRLKEEGAMLRAKIADLSMELANQFIGQNTILGSKLDNIDLTLKTIAGSVSLVGGFGGTAPNLALREPPITQQRALLESRDNISDNLAALRGAAGADRLGAQDLFATATRSAQAGSNIPGDTLDQEIINALEKLRSDLNERLELANEKLDNIDNSVGTTAPAATITPSAQQIDLNIQGEQNITVFGLDRAVDEIVRRVQELLGNFVDKAQFQELVELVLSNRRVLADRGLIVGGGQTDFVT